MDCLIHPCYFPNVAHIAAMYQAENVVLEIWDNYQKQTFRNRTEIYGANGKLSLTVPVSYSQNKRQLYKDVRIYNMDKWQQQHLKSLKAAYDKSPFFEFYIDELIPIFETKFEFILDLNLKCLEIIMRVLQFEVNFDKTTEFEKSADVSTDYRHLVSPKLELNMEPYVQMFSNKHGFLSNLSILDVLCNEGPATEHYLSQQKLTI